MNCDGQASWHWCFIKLSSHSDVISFLFGVPIVAVYDILKIQWINNYILNASAQQLFIK